MKRELEEVLLEKLIDYDDQIDMLKKDMLSIRMRASSQKKRRKTDAN